MKKIVKVSALIVVVCMMLCLCSCGEMKKAQGQLEAMLSSLQKGEYSRMLDEYICEKEENKDFLGCGDDFSKEGYPAYDAQMALFETMEYEILSGTMSETGDIVFDVEITTLNLEPVADRLVELSETFEFNYMEEMGDETNEEELQEIINEAILREQTAIITEYINSSNKTSQKYTVQVELCHNSKAGWKVHLNDELVNALAGGLYTKYGPDTK